jgi:conjugal transfer/entry exclusion protein
MDDCKHQMYYSEISTILSTNVIKCFNCHKVLGFIQSSELDDNIKKIVKEVEMIKKDIQQIKNALDVVYDEVQNNSKRT